MIINDWPLLPTVIIIIIIIFSVPSSSFSSTKALIHRFVIYFCKKVEK
jgi:hypothetical protein